MAIAPGGAFSTDALIDLAGRVVTPAAADFDDLRRAFYPGFDRRPAAIVQPADAHDVARAVATAREADRDLVVRGGGHSIAGHSTTDGGVLLDLARLRSLNIDTAAGTAWAGAGLTAGAYTAAVGAHGLATGFGDTGSVGIAGITLGGGVGYLARKHGLTIDSLLAAEIVTADGKVRYTDADLQPDLFWALRGGGGNYGVVTRLRFRLQPVDQVVAGSLVLPASPEIVAAFLAAADAAPRDLSVIANVMRAMPAPFIPERYHGQPVVFALMAYAGPPGEAGSALAPFRGLAEPIADLLEPMPYPALFPAAEDEERFPFVGTAIRSGYLDALSEAEGLTILDHLDRSTAPMSVVQLRVLGGAVDDVPIADTAYAHRGRGIMVNIAAGYADPADAATHRAWADDLAGRLTTDDAAYVNFLGEGSADRVRAAYPGETWPRLRAIKRRYDPDNLFRSNHNIPPADDVGI